MSEESIGTARIDIVANTETMQAGITAAKGKMAAFGAEAQAQYDRATAATKRYASSLADQINKLGLSRAEQLAYNAQVKIGGELGDQLARKAIANANAVAAAQSAQLKSAEWTNAQLLKANQALSAYRANLEATAAASKASADAQGEMAAADDARFKKIAADAMAEIDARKAVAAATLEQARANGVLAESQGAKAAGALGATAGAYDSASVQQEMADFATLDALMSKRIVTTEGVAEAEAALDRMQAAAALSSEDLAQAFAALDVVTAAETKSLQANTVAQIENAVATKGNSRTQYELGIMLGELASGNVNRLKRSTAALANSTGLLQAIMTPTGLAVAGVGAAIAAAGVAAYKGEENFSNFNRTLIATGNYAGITFDQYQQFARGLVDSNTSIGKAKDALNALLETGKFSGNALEQAAQAAVDMSNLTGDSIDKAVAAIQRLAEDPVKAIEKLDAQYHFLSTATLQHIAELEDQGNKQDAANLAEETYATALRKRAEEMETNLGTLQKVWQSLGSSASFAWDQMEGIGRPATPLSNLTDQYNKLLRFRTSIEDRMSGKGSLLDAIFAPDAIGGKSTAGMTLQQQLSLVDQMLAKLRGNMQPLQAAASAAAQSKADAAALQQAGNQGVETLAKLGISLDGIKSKQDKVREAATALFNVWQAGGKLPKGVSFTGPIADVPVGPGWDAIKAQLLKGSPQALAAKQSAAALAAFQSQISSLDTQSIDVPGNAALTKYVQAIGKLVVEFDKARAKGADYQKSIDAYWKGSASIFKKYQEEVAKSNAEVKAFVENLKQQIQTRQQLLDLQVRAVGMGSKESQQASKLLQIQQQYLTKQAQLDTQYANRSRGMTEQVYEEKSAALKRFYQAEVSQTDAYYEAIDKAQANWVNGAIAAMQDWADQGMNVAAQTKTLFTDAFTQMNDALVNFVETGKLNFSSLATSIIGDLVRMELRIAESKILQSILGSFLGGSGGAMATSFDSNGTFFSFGNGAAISSRSLSQYSGGVYDSPQLFKFAKGGVFGEAGPEAIMPLSRMPDGKLGVKSQAAQASGNTTVVIENHSGGTAQVQRSKSGNGDDIVRVIIQAAVEEVNKQIARGGSTAKVLGAKYGLAPRGVQVS